MRQLFSMMKLDTTTVMGKRAWALACPSITSVEKLALSGMGIYATNTVAARLRHAEGLVLSDAETLEALRQSVQESAKGRGQAIKILKDAWMGSEQPTASLDSKSQTGKLCVTTGKYTCQKTPLRCGEKSSKVISRSKFSSRRDAVFHTHRSASRRAGCSTDSSKGGAEYVATGDSPSAEVASSNGRHRMVRATSTRCNDCGHEETWCVCAQRRKKARA